MKRNGWLALALLAASAAPAMAQTALIESWENTLDGWSVPPSYNAQPFAPSFVTSPGVTNGTYSMAIAATGANTGSGPNYGQFLAGPSSMALTTLLSNASALNLDVYTPPGSFGYYLQFQMIINNSATGFLSLTGSNYTGTNIGSETTISAPITAADDALLAGSGTPTSIIIQVGGGYTAGSETMYVDNLTATLVPEPASMALLGLGMLPLLRRRRI